MSHHPVLWMARYTWLQSWCTRWLWLACAGMLLATGIGFFFYSLAIAESQAIFVAVATGAARLISVCVLSVFIIATVMRERQERALDWLLALQLSRRSYYLGRWLGFVTLAGVFVVLLAPILFWLVAPAVALTWLIGFWCELIVVSSFALLCAVTLRQLPLAMSATLGFYALARSADAVLAMATHPVLPDPNGLSTGVAYVAQAMTLVLPDLGSYAHSSALLYPSDLSAIGAVVLQTIIYALLLVSAGLIDFHRQELT